MDPRKICIIEDEGIVAIDIEECLQSFGYLVAGVAKSGEDAIKLVGEVRPDLVLMDIMLAGEMSGIEAAAAIKQRFDIPVVYLTAHADMATLERAKVTEPYGYILKPFKEMELRTVVELALHKHHMERGRTATETPIITDAQPKPELEQRLQNLETLVEADGPDAKRIAALLLKIEFLAHLGEPMLKRIASKCRFEDFRGGDVLISEGEMNRFGFIPVFGRIALLKASSSGKELIVDLLPPLDPFGLLANIEGTKFPLSVRAQVDTRVIWFPTEVVRLVFEQYPSLGQAFAKKVLDRLRGAHDLSRALAHDLVEVRIASSLVAVVSRFCNPDIAQEPYEVEITRQEIADLSGTTPETVSRVMKAMERDGLVDLTKIGLVKVLRLAGLEKIAQITAPMQAATSSEMRSAAI